jgi:presenilin-like A22 family membrane protease
MQSHKNPKYGQTLFFTAIFMATLLIFVVVFFSKVPKSVFQGFFSRQLVFVSSAVSHFLELFFFKFEVSKRVRA